MRICEALKSSSNVLSLSEIENPRVDSEILLAETLGKNRSFLLAHNQDSVDDPFLSTFFLKVKERSSGKPLQYITGKQEFYGLEFEVSPDVLIPRPETEILVEETLKQLSEEPFNLVDVGTGSGCLAVTLATYLAQTKFWAIDLSEIALQVAKRNALRHHVTKRIQFLHGNLLNPLHSRVTKNSIDIIVCNPPYISLDELILLQREVKDWEPHLALVGEVLESNIYSRLASQALLWLKPEGILILEIGAGMEKKVCHLFQAPWNLLNVSQDFNGVPRVVVVKKTI